MEGSLRSSDTPPKGGRESRDSVVIRFAGDSGDGMQLTGSQFALSSAIVGNDLSTFPDFPAEIRAPAGSTFGVSAFQVHFSAQNILTPGDEPEVLVAMNPAALKTNLADLDPGGMIVIDRDSFSDKNLRKARYEENPLEDQSLEGYRVLALDMSRLTQAAVKPFGLSQKESLRCKNMWALGLMMWMYDRDRKPTIDWLREKFANRSEIAEANVAALNAGHAFGETAELPNLGYGYSVPRAEIAPGEYRAVTGSETLAWGLAVGAQLADLKLVFASYPITPASNILHILAGLKAQGVVTFQAEDEIAAVCAAIGASYAGSIGVTSSAGPGVALKTEAIGLAVVAELPLVVVNSQRSGPSTGMPTKAEQSDLFQAVHGRNADTPLVVLAAHSPANCFETAIESIRLATKYMTPVMLLTDGYLANASEPWLIPNIEKLNTFPVEFHTNPDGFHPFMRDNETLARAWAIPGTPGLEHRIGGLEKDYATSNISYDPANHQRMTEVRAEKISGIANEIPLQEVAYGPKQGPLAVVGWGSTFGAIEEAVHAAAEEGLEVAHIHINYLNPMPKNMGGLLAGYKDILVPEMNSGQLVKLLRSAYLLPAEGLNKVTGQPFKVKEILIAIRTKLGNCK
ncbi:MAG TPA: 2-oxoacid:acceptor oxidoreductase subunit alpha [Alphaproteobacteria bacterium]|nr:MAG: 2-oxoglutarate oxidoreductase subunit KorA [Alphaproteobacteria bacterium MarineAlpha9_Bin6]PPR39292.1 MAG: 2-oxoglutarate oxidoreductase subunit KorA [Alphaproteobacteria bacterium MarineAlpha9_Bin5]HIC73145.1 2-oxoacid:acceptor oxidoreductase subunit alpha [Alphaproteobacteria bacterium]HIM72074.1 2-oxoacid:acceptor oxidoreductase subunit alpha [Alphaproteobacteria bacterium]